MKLQLIHIGTVLLGVWGVAEGLMLGQPFRASFILCLLGGYVIGTGLARLKRW